MSNIDIEKYIAGLSPELQEKAKACADTEELLKFADDNNIELPAEALEAVSGGCDSGVDKKDDFVCPKCGCTSYKSLITGNILSTYNRICKNCGTSVRDKKG